MVRDISRQNTNFPIGRVSISVDDLVSLVEVLQLTDVTAKNLNTGFDSIGDIKNHKSLFSGKPQINSKEITVNFSSYNSIYPLVGGDHHTILAKSFSQELAKRKSLLDRFSEFIHKFSFYFFIIIILLGLLTWTGYMPAMSDPVQLAVNLVTIIITAAFAIGHGWGGYGDFFRQPVYYRPSQGFFRRNVETIAIGLIGTALGSILTALLGKFSTWF
ncbi:hypothetical protein [Rhizobium tumorigenes]|uniref:Uncharacterized protein n=1 Tax=Rhizobium tumorigenes TaxID=2041385 RepID=A0AAF1KAR6_9HYPH|nr:hypothetical protein [Rhizobium tumorigenes]WFR96092.1 hypothetical protein PR017_02780 [Rhizobium tumorigenes]